MFPKFPGRNVFKKLSILGTLLVSSSQEDPLDNLKGRDLGPKKQEYLNAFKETKRLSPEEVLRVSNLLGLSVKEIHELENEFSFSLVVNVPDTDRVLVNIGQAHLFSIVSKADFDDSLTKLVKLVQIKIYRLLKQIYSKTNYECLYHEGEYFIEGDKETTFDKFKAAREFVLKSLSEHSDISPEEIFDWLNNHHKSFTIASWYLTFFDKIDQMVNKVDANFEKLDRKRKLEWKYIKNKIAEIKKMKIPQLVYVDAVLRFALETNIDIVCPAEHKDILFDDEEIYLKNRIRAEELIKKLSSIQDINEKNKVLDEIEGLQKEIEEYEKNGLKLNDLKRERFTVEMARHLNKSISVFGADHTFIEAVEGSNQTNPDTRINLVQITPKVK
jgi:hypothetical protein